MTKTANQEIKFSDLINKIDEILPQTQCRQCKYDDCKSYAKAIVTGQALHNQCPPGGASGIKKLSALLGREILPLNPNNGVHSAITVAVIDPMQCIGCTLCIQACPVDAIIGAPKHMHVVLSEVCTGCKLCVEPCPVDCIEMQIAPIKKQDRNELTKIIAKKRYEEHKKRVEQRLAEKNQPINLSAEHKKKLMENILK